MTFWDGNFPGSARLVALLSVRESIGSELSSMLLIIISIIAVVFITVAFITVVFITVVFITVMLVVVFTIVVFFIVVVDIISSLLSAHGNSGG